MTVGSELAAAADPSAGRSLVSAVTKTGVPAKLRTRAVKALARLLGVTLAAPLVQQARDAWDTIEGRSRINMAVADEVARRLIASDDYMARAVERFGGELRRKQDNVEAIGQETLKFLPAPDAAPSETEAEPEVPPISDDWMNMFVRYAEDASSEQLRQRFGRVLAGEIQAPGSFSPATLRSVAELDQEAAADLEVASKFVVGGKIMRSDSWQNDPLLSVGQRLEARGMLMSVGGFTSYRVTPNEAGYATFLGRKLGLIVFGSPGARFEFGSIEVTRTGLELLSLLPVPDEERLLRELAVRGGKTGVTQIKLGEIVGADGIRPGEIVFDNQLPN